MASHKNELLSPTDNASLFNDFYAKQELNIYKKVMTPAMILTWIAGLTLLHLHGYDWFKINLWMHFKLLFLIIISGYHGKCKSVIRDLTNGKLPFSEKKFDFFIDFPVYILLFLIPLAVFKISIYPMFTVIFSLIAVVLFIIAKTLLQKYLKQL